MVPHLVSVYHDREGEQVLSRQGAKVRWVTCMPFFKVMTGRKIRGEGGGGGQGTMRDP